MLCVSPKLLTKRKDNVADHSNRSTFVVRKNRGDRTVHNTRVSPWRRSWRGSKIRNDGGSRRYKSRHGRYNKPYEPKRRYKSFLSREENTQNGHSRDDSIVGKSESNDHSLDGSGEYESVRSDQFGEDEIMNDGNSSHENERSRSNSDSDSSLHDGDNGDDDEEDNSEDGEYKSGDKTCSSRDENYGSDDANSNLSGSSSESGRDANEKCSDESELREGVGMYDYIIITPGCRKIRYNAAKG